MPVEALEKRRLVQADDHHVAFPHDLVAGRSHQRGDMRNTLFDESTIRTEQSRDVDFRIVDLQVESLADEPLGHRDQRAFPQIVGAALEAETDHADRSAPASQHHLDRVLDVKVVALLDRRQHRRVDVAPPGRVEQRPQVLRQTRATEREPRLEIGRRDVELPVVADQRHDRMRVDADGLADSPDLVGEGDLQRVEGVAGVLQHLGGRDRGADELARQVPEQLAQQILRTLSVDADDGERRAIVILDRRAFAEELGLKAEAEAHAGGHSGVLLDQRPDQLVDRARQHGRTHDEQVAFALRADRLAELLRESADRGLVLATVR
ncbi:MAG TPA: hypothetical protein VD788_01800 [Candidatus Polarisedimenticolaceae bacterium]|nr:hypothetical protein [Candidatus Polarisedimenticolaceae bacterium]